MLRPVTRTTGPRPRGRIDKRRDLIEAAFRVFAREGYVGACVEAIAAEARTAKPTLYTHFGDKETLFREAVTEVSRSAARKSLDVVSELTEKVPDLREALEDIGLRLLECHCGDDAWALRRLLNAEIARFPDLFDAVLGGGTDGGNQVTEALADRLSRLMLADRLVPGDPGEAAGQFVALITGPVESSSALGTRPVPDDVRRRVVGAAVRTFLRAFGVRDASAERPS